MLVLLVGDGHLTGKNPVARTDDLVAVQFDKWEEIIQIANQYNCPIVSTGDVFHVPIIANSLLNRFGDLLNRLNHPLYFVWGNHDLMYHSLEMWDRTSLGVLWTLIEKVKHISEFSLDYGINWDYRDWDSPIEKSGSSLLLTHKAVVSEKQLGKNSWILEDKSFGDAIENEVSLQSYQLIFCGHWHRQYIFNHNGTKVINAGTIIRRTVDERQVPHVILVNLETRLTKQIVLQCAKATDDVISHSHLDAKAHNIKADIAQFVDQLKQRGNRSDKVESLIEILMKLLDNHELEPEVEAELRDIISVVMTNKQRKGE
jgi:predicted phosphodiesterase